MRTLTLSLLMLLPFVTSANTVKDPHPQDLACLITYHNIRMQRFIVFKGVKHELVEPSFTTPDKYPVDPKFFKTERMICILARDKDHN